MTKTNFFLNNIYLFHAYSVDFSVNPHLACCKTEEGGERERDSHKIVEVL
jgi:hypothetical protein